MQSTLLICRNFPPPTLNGMSKYMLNLALGLKNSKINVVVLAGHESKHKSLIENYDTGIHIYKSFQLEKLKEKPHQQGWYKKILEKIIIKHQVKHVFLQHPYHTASVISLKNKYNLNVNYICHTITLPEINLRKVEPHYCWEELNLKNEIYSFNQVDKIIAVSDFLKKALINYYKISPRKIIHITTGVNEAIPSFKESLTKLQIASQSGKKLILYIGRESWEKGTDVIPDIIVAVNKVSNNHMFVLIGIQEKNHIKYLHQDRTILLPWLNENELAALYSICDILLVPSRRDSMPYVLLEGMLWEVVPVASDVEGLSEVIEHNINGIKIPLAKDYGKLMHNIALFRDNILSLLENKTLYHELKKNTKRAIQNKHSMRIQIDSYLELIL
jgi:glycogen synthase